MESNCTLCWDPQTLLEFLRKVDYTLPVPLSARVDLEKFARSSVEGLVYGICRDGQLEAAALVIYGYLEKPYAYLNLLATVPHCQGQGYGGCLLEIAEAAARKDGMTEFHLHTNAENTRAVGFYTRRGYQIIGTEPKLHMVKAL